MPPGRGKRARRRTAFPAAQRCRLHTPRQGRAQTYNPEPKLSLSLALRLTGPDLGPRPSPEPSPAPDQDGTAPIEATQDDECRLLLGGASREP